MAYRKTNHLLNALNDDEMEIYRLYYGADIRFVTAKYMISEMEAKVMIENIHAKVQAYKDHEERQMKRGEYINMARIAASIQGTNELLIMSEV
jgi:hypothetical protein